MAEKNVLITAEIQNKFTGLDHSVVNCAKLRDWVRLRELSIRPGGFGEDRACVWPFLMHIKMDNDTCKMCTTSINDEPQLGVRRRRRHLSSQNTFNNDLDNEKNFESPDNETMKHPDEHQIKLDTDRSFVLYSVDDHTDREELQAELNQLITSIFRRHPKLGYFQGYHDIMTVLYLTLPEDVQFQCAERLSLHRLRDAMGKGLEPLLGLLTFLKLLIRQADPEYSALLERSAPLPYFALSNLLTLFSHDVPTLPLIQHVFDYLLCRPPIASVYLEAAIIISRREEAFRLEQEGEEGMLHSLLSSLPELSDGNEPKQPNEEQSEPLTKNQELFIDEKIAVVDYNEVPSEDFSSKILANDVEPNFGELTVSEPSLDHPNPEEPGSDQSLHGIQVSLPESNVLSDVDGFPPKKEESLYPKEKLEASLTNDVKTDSEEEKDETQSNAHTLLSSSIPSDLSSADLDSSKPVSPIPSSRSASPFHIDDHGDHHDDHDNDNGSPINSDLGESPHNNIRPSPGSPRHRRNSSITISLPSLLARADELLSQFPPNHPELHLEDILGPQSVVFTWSENPHDLASDAEAEAMVIRPDLVVRPFTEPDDNGGDGDKDVSDESSGRLGDDEKKTRKRRKRFRRSKKLNAYYLGNVQFDKKTVLAGAAVALGVAVAVHHLSSKEGGSSSGGGGLGILSSFGSDPSRAERAFRKVARAFGAGI